MGNATNPASNPTSPRSPADPSASRFSLRIVKVFKNSPGFKSGLESFLDFITEIETLTPMSKTSFSQLSEPSSSSVVLAEFSRMISENANKPLIFTVFNIYSQKARRVHITPNRDWENADSFLGVLVRLEPIESALERTFRVLSVLRDSPAEKSGLLAETDFILGLTYNKYQDINEFKAMIEEDEEKDKEICVFNEKTGEVRHLWLKGNRDWGGKGLLGCEFGFGARNQLKPGLENVAASREAAVSSQENTVITEQIAGEETEKSLKSKGSFSEKTKKLLKIPPKNPFTLMKKPSFEQTAEKGEPKSG